MKTHFFRRAFTLLDLAMVIIVLLILSGIAIPKYFEYRAAAAAQQTKMILSSVRSAVAEFWADSVARGADHGYPTLVGLQTAGIVLKEPIPANPYNNDNKIASAIWDETLPVSGTNGWNYDSVRGRFWANSKTVDENTW